MGVVVAAGVFPDRTGHRRERAVFAVHRADDGVGIGEHGEHDARAVGRVPRGARQVGAVPGERLGLVARAVPHPRRQPGAGNVAGDGEAHRAARAEHRDRLGDQPPFGWPGSLRIGHQSHPRADSLETRPLPADQHRNQSAAAPPWPNARSATVVTSEVLLLLSRSWLAIDD